MQHLKRNGRFLLRQVDSFSGIPKGYFCYTSFVHFAVLCSMFWKKKNKYRAPEIHEGNFKEEVMDASTPVVLDFWGERCSPCSVMSSIVDELAEEYQGRILVGKVQAALNPRLSQVFQIKSIPTFVIIKDGKVLERYQGIVPKPNFQEILDAHLDTTSPSS
jgi:thioredoxin 1